MFIENTGRLYSCPQEVDNLVIETGTKTSDCNTNNTTCDSIEKWSTYYGNTDVEARRGLSGRQRLELEQ